jgi:hypothetical protein
MTQFWITVSFDDSERDVLQRALHHYLEVCRQEIKKGGSVPFEAHRLAIKRFRASLRKQLKQTRSFTMDEGEIDAVQHALQSYLDACERASAKGATMSDKTMIKKICATLGDKLERAVINASIRWAVRTKVYP